VTQQGAAQSPGPPLRTHPRRRPGGLVGKGANALLFIFAAGADLSILTVCDFPKGLVCGERAAFIVVTKDTRCARNHRRSTASVCASRRWTRGST